MSISSDLIGSFKIKEAYADFTILEFCRIPIPVLIFLPVKGLFPGRFQELSENKCGSFVDH